MNKNELNTIKNKSKESTSLINDFIKNVSTTASEPISKDMQIINFKLDIIQRMCQDIIGVLSDLFLSQSSHFTNIKQNIDTTTTNIEQQLDKISIDVEQLNNPFYQVVADEDDEDIQPDETTIQN